MRTGDIREIDHIVHEEGISREQRRLFQEELSGQDLSLDDNREIAKELKELYPSSRTMDNNHPQDVSTLVQSIRGLPCWSVSCGGCTLPTFQLALGDKVRRPGPLKNPAQSEEYRQFEGEANLLVWCTWRLDAAEGPLTSSDDDEAGITTHLGRLSGATVEAVAVTSPALDLTISFSGSLTLRVFCDHVPGAPSFDGNWDLWLKGVGVFVGPGARSETKPRAELVEPA
jgi:hypothetical protein